MNNCLSHLYNTYFPTYFGCIVLIDSSFENSLGILSIQRRESQISLILLQGWSKFACIIYSLLFRKVFFFQFHNPLLVISCNTYYVVKWGESSIQYLWIQAIRFRRTFFHIWLLALHIWNFFSTHVSFIPASLEVLCILVTKSRWIVKRKVFPTAMW